MNLEVLIIDFFDSFTYNIAAEIHKLGFKFTVIESSLEVFKKIEHIKEKKIILLGPGPGHPDDYKEIYPYIKKNLAKKNLFFFGICLGHQILWRIHGYNITNSSQPLHGKAVPFKIPPWKNYFDQRDWGRSCKVQRYNSLTVRPKKGNLEKFALCNGEIMAGQWERGLTYQFHPESIGTEIPEIFFWPLKKIFL